MRIKSYFLNRYKSCNSKAVLKSKLKYLNYIKRKSKNLIIKIYLKKLQRKELCAQKRSSSKGKTLRITLFRRFKNLIVEKFNELSVKTVNGVTTNEISLKERSTEEDKSTSIMEKDKNNSLAKCEEFPPTNTNLSEKNMKILDSKIIKEKASNCKKIGKDTQKSKIIVVVHTNNSKDSKDKISKTKRKSDDINGSKRIKKGIDKSANSLIKTGTNVVEETIFLNRNETENIKQINRGTLDFARSIKDIVVIKEVDDKSETRKLENCVGVKNTSETKNGKNGEVNTISIEKGSESIINLVEKNLELNKYIRVINVNKVNRGVFDNKMNVKKVIKNISKLDRGTPKASKDIKDSIIDKKASINSEIFNSEKIKKEIENMCGNDRKFDSGENIKVAQISKTETGQANKEESNEPIIIKSEKFDKKNVKGENENFGEFVDKTLDSNENFEKKIVSKNNRGKNNTTVTGEKTPVTKKSIKEIKKREDMNIFKFVGRDPEYIQNIGEININKTKTIKDINIEIKNIKEIKKNDINISEFDGTNSELKENIKEININKIKNIKDINIVKGKNIKLSNKNVINISEFDEINSELKENIKEININKIKNIKDINIGKVKNIKLSNKNVINIYEFDELNSELKENIKEINIKKINRAKVNRNDIKKENIKTRINNDINNFRNTGNIIEVYFNRNNDKAISKRANNDITDSNTARNEEIDIIETKSSEKCNNEIIDVKGIKNDIKNISRVFRPTINLKEVKTKKESIKKNLIDKKVTANKKCATAPEKVTTDSEPVKKATKAKAKKVKPEDNTKLEQELNSGKKATEVLKELIIGGDRNNTEKEEPVIIVETVTENTPKSFKRKGENARNINKPKRRRLSMAKAAIFARENKIEETRAMFKRHYLDDETGEEVKKGSTSKTDLKSKKIVKFKTDVAPHVLEPLIKLLKEITKNVKIKSKRSKTAYTQITVSKKHIKKVTKVIEKYQIDRQIKISRIKSTVDRSKRWIKNLRVISLNINSATNKVLELAEQIRINRPDILFLQETKRIEKNARLVLNGYIIIEQYASELRGQNGLIVAVRTELNGLYTVENIDHNSIEIMLRDKNKDKLCIINNYVPMTNAREEHLRKMGRKLGRDCNTVIIGDWNTQKL